jgi:hypothetical protein
LTLLKSIITVSLETMKIVNSLPPLKERKTWLTLKVASRTLKYRPHQITYEN